MERETGNVIGLSGDQFRALVQAASEHPFGLRIVELNDGYDRLELLDADGEIADTKMLFPVGP